MCHEVEVFSCQALLKPHNLDVHLRFVENLAGVCKKNGLYNCFCCCNIRLDNQHCDASESRAKLRIDVGNQNHPKLSSRTYGFSCAI